MLTEEDKRIYELYFQKNSEYYIEELERFRESGRCSFSLKALLLGVFWMGYRKMYLHILIFLGIVVAEYLIEELLLNLNVISVTTYDLLDSLSIIVYAILIGLFANRLYIKKSIRDVDTILRRDISTDSSENLIHKKGGTSWLFPVVFSALLVLACFASVFVA